ncbi:MAG: DNA internalization-related competence protein ComEC/Rec2 [Anaerolineales bacterium]|nr:DNA internalization-related competence protein ComEC/Rec2 [Anaerolineales bacterium]
MTAVYLGIGWLIGIWLASVADAPLWVWLAGGGLSLVGAVMLRRQLRLSWLLMALAGLGWGGARYITAVPAITAAHVAYYNNSDSVTLVGLVNDEPDVRDRYVNLRLRVESITFANGGTRPVSGNVLVRTSRFPVIGYGTRVQINGRLETPPEFTDFSYKEYLARQGIHSLVSYPTLIVLAENQGHPLKQAIFAFKARAQASINCLIPEPQAALLSGILLGNDNGLATVLNDAFRNTGMTHIIAISGFNIAILIGIFIGLAEPALGKRGGVVAAIVGVTLYTILVGASASVVRAALMGSLYLIGSRWFGRPNFAYAALFLASLIMTLLNPHTLWDVGFQLSFSATLGLILYADPLTRHSRRWLGARLGQRSANWLIGLLGEAVIVTIAAQILTQPLIVAYFGQLSLISLPANIVILPAQPGVMIWGGLATLTGMAIPAIGQLFAWVAWLFLWYTTTLVRFFADIPGSAVSLQLNTAGIIAIYALIFAITWLAKQEPEQRARLWSKLRQNQGRRIAYGGSALAAVLTLGWGMTQPDGQLHVTFFDVGQGDAIFIQTPSGHQILVDGGYYPNILNDELGRRMPFWDREIDMLVATHPDADHVTGLVEVFARYRVHALLTDGSGLGESAVYDELLRAAVEGGTAVHKALAGEIINLGDGARLEVLHPGTALHEDRNENSVSLRLVYGDFSLLLTGDAEETAEQQMLAGNYPLQSLVFKAGHHGSRTSSTLPFLQAVQPQIIVVSAGADNRFGHPHQEMLDRARTVSAAVLRTDELGSIEVITNGRTMWWQAWR